MAQVMIVAGSRHGATRGIADRIGEVLRGQGHEVSIYDAKEAPGPQWADAVVIGGAAYMGKWVDEVTDYMRRHHVALAERPTWLFASGPVGTDTVNKKGRDVLAPPEFLRNAAVDVLAEGIRVFFGRWDPSDEPVTLAERLFKKLPIPGSVLPVGDFRDWPAIDAWAMQIARDLVEEPVPTG